MMGGGYLSGMGEEDVCAGFYGETRGKEVMWKKWIYMEQ